jgi:hypothetical protein
MHDISIDLDTIVFYECLMPLSTISHYIVAVSFIDEGNQIIIGIHILSTYTCLLAVSITTKVLSSILQPPQ